MPAPGAASPVAGCGLRICGRPSVDSPRKLALGTIKNLGFVHKPVFGGYFWFLVFAVCLFPNRPKLRDVAGASRRGAEAFSLWRAHRSVRQDHEGSPNK
jgi:hypothetical protein